MRNILILGESGTGKSTSLRNLNPKETVIIQPNKKKLPFIGASKMYNDKNKNLFFSNDFDDLGEKIKLISEKALHVKNIIVDDLFHIILAKTIADAKKPGFQKFTDLATEFYKNTVGLDGDLRDDLNIVYLSHSELERDSVGNEKTVMKLSGKMISNTINPPSFFTYVLETKILFENGQSSYKFLTNSRSSADLSKTPMGLFDDRLIDNDLQYVLDVLKEKE